jgi:hypothetical protein
MNDLSMFWVSTVLFGTWFVLGAVGAEYFMRLLAEEVQDDDQIAQHRKKNVLRMFCASTWIMILGLLGFAYLFDILNGVKIRQAWDTNDFLFYMVGGNLVCILGVWLVKFKESRKKTTATIQLDLVQDTPTFVTLSVSVNSNYAELESELTPDLLLFIYSLQNDFDLLAHSHEKSLQPRKGRYLIRNDWFFRLRAKGSASVAIGPFKYSHKETIFVSNQITYTPNA